MVRERLAGASKFEIGAMIDQSQELHVSPRVDIPVVLGANSVLSAQDQAAHAGAISNSTKRTLTM